MPKVSVIIVNYNAGERLKRCIKALTEQSFQDFETIIIDNASTDGSIEFARADTTIKLIDAGTNLGFAAANNLAAKTAETEWLAFLNPDAYAEADWLKELMAAVKRYPEVHAFGSTQLNADDPQILDGVGDVYFSAGRYWRGGFGQRRERLPTEGECFAPCGAAALYQKSVFDTLGGFEELFFCYGEDVDLGFKLRLAGGKAIQVPKAIVLHEGSGITGRQSDFSIYHGHRNRIWIYIMNMPTVLLILTLPMHLVINAGLLIAFMITGRAKPYLRGVFAALKGMPQIWALRKVRQKERKASLGDIVRALTWSPLKMLRRGTDIRMRMKG